jgi:hypothetical protein
MVCFSFLSKLCFDLFLFVSIVTLEQLCENVEYIEKYDAIIASEVIEHIIDVDSFIGNIAKLLKVRKTSSFRKCRETPVYSICSNSMLIFYFYFSPKVFVLLLQ